LSTIQFRLIFKDKGHKSLEYCCLVIHLTSVISTISNAESNGGIFILIAPLGINTNTKTVCTSVGRAAKFRWLKTWLVFVLSPTTSKKTVFHFRGQKKFSGTINYQYWSIFTRILHEELYFNNKLRDFWLFGFIISHLTNTYGFSFEKTDNIFANCIFVRIREIFTTNRETWRSARKPGDSRLNRETWQLWCR
jgi:hypothetical protein